MMTQSSAPSNAAIASTEQSNPRFAAALGLACPVFNLGLAAAVETGHPRWAVPFGLLAFISTVAFVVELDATV